MKKVHEIFAQISAHQVEGMMLHSDMADYFTFLGAEKMAQLHAERFCKEAKCMHKTHEYFITHYGEILRPNTVGAHSWIPEAWDNVRRAEVESGAREKAIREGVKIWHTWEKKTKERYQRAHIEMQQAGEVAAAMWLSMMICDADEEAANAETLLIQLDIHGGDERD